MGCIKNTFCKSWLCSRIKEREPFSNERRHVLFNLEAKVTTNTVAIVSRFLKQIPNIIRGGGGATPTADNVSVLTTHVFFRWGLS